MRASLLKCLFLGALTLCAGARPAAAIDVHRDDVKQFIAHVAGTSSFTKHQLRKILKAAQSQPNDHRSHGSAG